MFMLYLLLGLIGLAGLLVAIIYPIALRIERRTCRRYGRHFAAAYQEWRDTGSGAALQDAKQWHYRISSRTSR